MGEHLSPSSPPSTLIISLDGLNAEWMQDALDGWMPGALIHFTTSRAIALVLRQVCGISFSSK
jgi:hypothetical protein